MTAALPNRAVGVYVAATLVTTLKPGDGSSRTAVRPNRAVGVYVATTLIATCSCLLLPIETRGQELKDRGLS
jgi:hypothetical protein